MFKAMEGSHRHFFFSRHRQSGFTLIEALVAMALLAIIGIGTFQIFWKVSTIVKISGVKVDASALANEQIEIMRNLPYADVGILNGVPAGKVQRTQTITRDNLQFLVTTTIRNVDDPFDGTIGGLPNDLSPADYKLVEIRIACLSCPTSTPPLIVTTTVAPKNLETASTNGALFINVFDASGQPVHNANVHVANTQEDPDIIIDEQTNADGILQLVDVPPGINAYEITVTKGGYSTDQTYQPGAGGNPNPSKPHASVLLQQVTQISFAIDQVSSVAVTTTTETCTPVGSIDFTLTGAKLIGTEPDLPKYSVAHTTDGAGTLALSNLEWDTYTIDMTDTAYELTGAVPLLTMSLSPNQSQDLKLTVKTKNPRSALISVKDSATQLPISDATVQLSKTGFDETRITGRGFLLQTDWAGGSGQELFTDTTKYFNDDGHVDTAVALGVIQLHESLGVFDASGELISSTFDTGSPSMFHQLFFLPQTQAPETGPESVRFQIATNNDNTTWNFLGPDGTDATYYSTSEVDIHPSHDGQRYLRYKVLVQTADTTVTPIISDVAFTFTSDCIPAGQVLFDGLGSGTYALTVTKTGYQTANETVDVSDPWQLHEVILIPE